MGKMLLVVMVMAFTGCASVPGIGAMLAQRHAMATADPPAPTSEPAATQLDARAAFNAEQVRQTSKAEADRRAKVTADGQAAADQQARLVAAGEARAKEEDAAAQESTQALLRDKPRVRFAWSVELYTAQAARRATLAAIAKRRHYSHIGGAVNLTAMNELQEQVEADDERIGRAQTALRRAKTTPLPMGSGVELAVRCMVRVETTDETPEDCEDRLVTDDVKILAANLEAP